MIRPLSPVRPCIGLPGAVNVNITLTMNDGTVCRPRLADGELRVVGQTKPLRPSDSLPPPVAMSGHATPPAMRAVARPPPSAAKPPEQRPLF